MVMAATASCGVILKCVPRCRASGASVLVDDGEVCAAPGTARADDGCWPVDESSASAGTPANKGNAIMVTRNLSRIISILTYNQVAHTDDRAPVGPLYQPRLPEL